MKIYNKLVRDNIPEIIKASGKDCEISILNDKQYTKEIKNKIVEEANELNEANTKEEMIEELADLFELLDYLLINEEIDLLKVKKKRIQKNMVNGGFDEKLYLLNVKG